MLRQVRAGHQPLHAQRIEHAQAISVEGRGQAKGGGQEKVGMDAEVQFTEISEGFCLDKYLLLR